MFIVVDINFDNRRQTIVPLVFRIFSDIGGVTVAPAWIDSESSLDTGIDQLTFFGQAGFLQQLTMRRVGGRFTRFQ